MDIILASKSIDRNKILKRVRISFENITTNIDEGTYKNKIKDGVTLAKELAKQKALKAKLMLEPMKKIGIIIAADTIVMFQDKIIGKPTNRNHAFQILKNLQNNSHILITGLAVTHTVAPKIVIDYDSTIVEFSALSDDEIHNYLDSNEWKGRAGAYSIMDKASVFIKSIKGSPSNVIGLPMQKLYVILKNEFHLDLLN